MDTVDKLLQARVEEVKKNLSLIETLGSRYGLTKLVRFTDHVGILSFVCSMALLLSNWCQITVVPA